MISPINFGSPQISRDLDFSSLAQLPQVYRQAQNEAIRRDTLASLGQGGQIDPMRLIQSGDMNLANLGIGIMNRQQDQQRQAAQDQLQRERYAVDDKFRAQQLGQTAAYQNRSLKLQEEAAKGKPTVQKLKDENGSEYLVRVDPNGNFQRLEAPPSPGAAASPDGGQTNPFAYGGQKETESKDSGYANRMFRAEGILRAPESMAAATSSIQRSIDRAPIVGSSGYTGLGNFVQSKEYQKYDQAARDFINATLRRESGAAISESEFENAYRQYLPRPGDSPEVLREKQRNRQETIASIAGGGGKNYRPPFTFDPEGNMVRIEPKRNVPTTATNTPLKPGGNKTSTGVTWSVEP